MKKINMCSRCDIYFLSYNIYFQWSDTPICAGCHILFISLSMKNVLLPKMHYPLFYYLILDLLQFSLKWIKVNKCHYENAMERMQISFSKLTIWKQLIRTHWGWDLLIDHGLSRHLYNLKIMYRISSKC